VYYITAALDYMSKMEDRYEQLKVEEKQLRYNLAIFNLKYVKPPQLNIKKVRKY